MKYDATLEPSDPDYVAPDLDSTIIGFLSGSSGGELCTPVSWIEDHLREMRVTPRGRVVTKERLDHFAAMGWVEHLPNKGWRFTTTGRAYAATKYGYDWLIQEGE